MDGHKHDGQFARRRQRFYDPKRYASLSRSAGQNDSSAGLAHRQAAALGDFLLPEYAHAAGDGLVLHAGFGLNCIHAIRICAVLALLGCGILLPLLVKVVSDVDQFEGLPVHRR